MTRRKTEASEAKRARGGAGGEVRCAIYTRKSTEEGLELEFNSLDAQRESSEAYIASQKAEGWVCLPERYDDGGYSGGNVERPALKRLMGDIEAGKVDCVVVYKVDRLSRSLMDFSRLMETFDRRGVSFVSVTQQFNTTHSMGRLTLNILLSFAQFEREIISERTRDKIAAARRRGKWAGGRPVLGYDLVPGPGGSKLFVNPEEADRVRRMFAAYLRGKSVMSVVNECARLGWTTKQWTTRAGKPQGGRAIDTGIAYAILTNPVYIGKVRHNEHVYDGEHEAIVEQEVFDRVQAQLRLNGRTGGSRMRNAQNGLLKGLVRCKCCSCGMIHHYATSPRGKSKKIYRYYVCMKAQKQGWRSCPGPSLPASDLEMFVLDRVREMLVQDRQVEAVARDALELLQGADPERLAAAAQLVGSIGGFEQLWKAMTQREREALIRALVVRVEWDAEEESVSVTFRSTADAEELQEACAA